MLEHFRGSPHAEIIALLAAQVEADTGDEGEQEVVFTDTIERLRARDLRRQIDALNAKEQAGGLSQERRRTLAMLLARKSA